jgi:hypothetical protein
MMGTVNHAYDDSALDLPLLELIAEVGLVVANQFRQRQGVSSNAVGDAIAAAHGAERLESWTDHHVEFAVALLLNRDLQVAFVEAQRRVADAVQAEVLDAP